MNGRQLERIAGLDGLRAIAVGAVIVYHLGIDWLPGGFLGVDMFFVISGFLITTLLLEEFSRTGRIDVRRFYCRRIRRLFPALVAVLAGTIVLASTIARDSAHTVSRDAIAALFYVNNWWAIFKEQSYFDIIGRGNPLGHLWSLAIEEQFYLVWPALLVCGVWLTRKRMKWLRLFVGVVGIGGAALSTWRMWMLADQYGYPIDADPSRAYFGTDTHAMSILVGVALAAVWQPRELKSEISKPWRFVASGAGMISLALLWVFVNEWNEYWPPLYQGGFLVVSAVVSLLLVSVTLPRSGLGKVLDNSVTSWIGERSYGIYLWHFPIFLVTRPGLDFAAEGVLVNLLRIGLVITVAAVSYRWLEVPIRNGAISAAFGRLRTRGFDRAMRWQSVAAAAGAIVVGTAFMNASMVGPEAFAAEFRVTSGASVTSTIAESSTPPTMSESPSVSSTTNGAAVSRVTGSKVSWFGDSVSLWSLPAIEKVLPKVYLNARLNQSPGAMFTLVNRAKQAGTLRAFVVLHLGTGGPISESALRTTLRSLKGRTGIVLVNSTARFAYVLPNNRLITRVAREFENVRVADWKSYSAGHRDWFKDGLHCSEKGKLIFAKFVYSVLVRTTT